MNVEERLEQIISAMVDALINDGRAEMSVKEIAERAGLTPVQTGYALDKSFSIDRGWIRVSPCEVYIDVREKNFGTVTHQRRCRGYKLTLEYLGKLIKNLREKCSEKPAH